MHSRSILKRVAVCIIACLALICGFYLSMIASAESLTPKQKKIVRDATAVIQMTGFSTEAMLLKNFTVYRSTDNWLNAMVAKENAYAATNFPFEIMTLYSDFFTYPADDTERAAILLHEARHLQGGDEKDAYEFVWKNRAALGWTRGKYYTSPVWINIRNQTREYAPHLFVCEEHEFSDCTE